MLSITSKISFVVSNALYILFFPESKTYTVFAPTDTAFARLSPAELSRYSDKAAARALVARHVLPGTLYSAGMRYYQLRNSMEDAKPLTLQKSSGKYLYPDTY